MHNYQTLHDYIRTNTHNHRILTSSPSMKARRRTWYSLSQRYWTKKKLGLAVSRGILRLFPMIDVWWMTQLKCSLRQFQIFSLWRVWLWKLLKKHSGQLTNHLLINFLARVKPFSVGIRGKGWFRHVPGAMFVYRRLDRSGGGIHDYSTCYRHILLSTHMKQ